MAAVDDYQQYRPWSTTSAFAANTTPQEEGQQQQQFLHQQQATATAFPTTAVPFEQQHHVPDGSRTKSTTSGRHHHLANSSSSSHFFSPPTVVHEAAGTQTQPVTPHQHQHHQHPNHHQHHPGIPPLHTNFAVHPARGSQNSGTTSPSPLSSSATTSTSASASTNTNTSSIGTPSSASTSSLVVPITPLSSRPTSSSVTADMGFITTAANMDPSAAAAASYAAAAAASAGGATYPFGSTIGAYPAIIPGSFAAQVPSGKFDFECSLGHDPASQGQHPGGGGGGGGGGGYENAYYGQQYMQQQQQQQQQQNYAPSQYTNTQYQQQQQQQRQPPPPTTSTTTTTTTSSSSSLPRLRLSPQRTAPTSKSSGASAPNTATTPTPSTTNATPSTATHQQHFFPASTTTTGFHDHAFQQQQRHQQHQNQNQALSYTHAQSRSQPQQQQQQQHPPPKHTPQKHASLPTYTHGARNPSPQNQAQKHHPQQQQQQGQGQGQGQQQQPKPFLSLSTIALQIQSNAAAQKKNLAPRGADAAGASSAASSSSNRTPPRGGNAGQSSAQMQQQQQGLHGGAGQHQHQQHQQQGQSQGFSVVGKTQNNHSTHQQQQQHNNSLHRAQQQQQQNLTQAERRLQIEQELKNAGFLYTPHSGQGAGAGGAPGSRANAATMAALAGSAGGSGAPQQYEYNNAQVGYGQVQPSFGASGSGSAPVEQGQAQAQGHRHGRTPSSSSAQIRQPPQTQTQAQAQSQAQWNSNNIPAGLAEAAAQGGLSVAGIPSGETGAMSRRPGGACTRCKKMKMKCTFPTPAASTCLRCLTSNTMQPCTVEGRKPRTPSAKEALLAKLREKDAIIAKILAQWVVEREDLGGGPGGGPGPQIVLAGGKVVAALENDSREKDGGGGGSHSQNSATAPTKRGMSLDLLKPGPTTFPMRANTLPGASSSTGSAVLGPTERAALMSAEKGGMMGSSSGAGGPISGLVGLSRKGLGLGLGMGMGMKKEKEKEKSAAGGDDSDEEWSSDEDTTGEGDDAWDEEFERRWGEVDPAASSVSPSTPTPTPGPDGPNTPSSASTFSLPVKALPSSGHLQLVSLPPRISPMGLIARLSLEDGGVRGLGSTTASVFGKSVVGGGSSVTVKREESTTPTPTTPRSAHQRANSILSAVPSTSSSLRKRLFPPPDEDDSSDDEGSSNGDDEPLTAIEEGEGLCGIASPEYFHPGPASNLALRRVLNSRAAPPPILATGLINWEEVEELFDIFFNKVSIFVTILDENLHTPQSVYERDPFLFTVVCAISSRYLPSRPKLHTIAMHFAKSAAANALISGTKSIEMAQAYLLLSVHGLPARRWEEDRSWFYGGLAGRIATDLALNRTSSSMHENNSSVFLGERHAREKLNRIRTWLNCWNVDRSSSTQFGKPTSLEEDEVVERITEVAGGKGWWKSSQFNHKFDVHLVWYTELLKVMSRFHERVKEKARNIRAITKLTEDELHLWHDRVTQAYERDSDPDDPVCVFRARGYSLFENYMRLAMYSFGFEEAWKRRRKLDHEEMFFPKCLQCATSIVKQLCEDYAPMGFLRYAPDCYFVMGGFSGAFLLKMLRPEFSVLLDSTIRERIISQIRSFIKVLSSEAAAINDMHTPMLYAKFLHTQLKHVLQETEKPAAPSSEEQQAQSSSSQLICKQEDSETPRLHGMMDSAGGAGSSGAATPRNRQNALPQPTTTTDDRRTPTPAAYAAANAQNHAQQNAVAAAAQSQPTVNFDTFDWSAAFMNNYTPSTSFNDWSSNGSESHTVSGAGLNNVFPTGDGLDQHQQQHQQQQGIVDDSMEICEDELLSSMQAVSGGQWLNSVLMPGFRWPSPTSGGSISLNMSGIGGAGMMDVEIVGSPTSSTQQEQSPFSPSQQQFQQFSPHQQQQQFQQSPVEQQQFQQGSDQQQYQMGGGGMSMW